MMFTSIDKAITAFVMAVLFFLDQFAGLHFGLDEGTVSTIAAALSPFLVWLIPNRA